MRARNRVRLMDKRGHAGTAFASAATMARAAQRYEGSKAMNITASITPDTQMKIERLNQEAAEAEAFVKKNDYFRDLPGFTYRVLTRIHVHVRAIGASGTVYDCTTNFEYDDGEADLDVLLEKMESYESGLYYSARYADDRIVAAVAYDAEARESL